MDADWERLCEDLQKEGTNYEGNIEDLFRAELYLISPITDPVRFLKKEYFLTSQQRDIEKKILRDIYAKRSGCFWFSGIPGMSRFISRRKVAVKIAGRIKDQMAARIMIKGSNLIAKKEKPKHKYRLKNIEGF